MKNPSKNFIERCGDNAIDAPVAVNEVTHTSKPKKSKKKAKTVVDNHDSGYSDTHIGFDDAPVHAPVNAPISKLSL